MAHAKNKVRTLVSKDQSGFIPFLLSPSPIKRLKSIVSSPVVHWYLLKIKTVPVPAVMGIT